MIYHSNSSKETRDIAKNLAVKIIKGPTSLKLRRASVITLEGELGAGKTTFVQAFAKALGIKSKIKSPTFNIIKKYRISSKNYSLVASRYLYHIDCYRLRNHKDALLIGIKEIFKEKDSIVLIEWPERIGKILPKNIVRVHIDHIGEKKRKIKITNIYKSDL